MKSENEPLSCGQDVHTEGEESSGLAAGAANKAADVGLIDGVQE